MAYYVSVTDDRDESRYGLLAGPFNRHGDALAYQDRAAAAADQIDRRAHWYRYGTCRIPRGPLPVGILNEALGFPTDGTRITLPDPVRNVVDLKTVMSGTGPPPYGWVRCDGERPGCYADDNHFHPTRQEVAA